MLANRADGAQRGDFAAPRGIREQARSYPIQGERLLENSQSISVNESSSDSSGFRTTLV